MSASPSPNSEMSRELLSSFLISPTKHIVHWAVSVFPVSSNGELLAEVSITFSFKPKWKFSQHSLTSQNNDQCRVYQFQYTTGLDHESVWRDTLTLFQPSRRHIMPMAISLCFSAASRLMCSFLLKFQLLTNSWSQQSSRKQQYFDSLTLSWDWSWKEIVGSERVNPFCFNPFPARMTS